MQSSHPTGILTRSIVTLLAISSSALATDNLWTGAISNDWNTAGNWSLGRVPSSPSPAPDGFDDAIINIIAPNIATITANLSSNPRDIKVGAGGGTNGLVNHLAGTASTGGGNWMFVGIDTGTGRYNLADTTAAGGTFTGLGTGSGSLNVGGRLYIGGGDNANGGTGRFDMNTTGTLTIGNDLWVGRPGGTGVFNMDAGTLNRTGGWTVIGEGAAGNGTFRMSGGTVTAVAETIVGRVAGSSGTYTQSGGTYNAGGLFQVGREGGTGTATVNGATATLTTGEMHIGNDAGSNGSMTLSAGTISGNSWIGIGRNAATGILTINGGTMQQTGAVIGQLNAGTLELTNGGVGGTGTVNLDGGNLIVNRVDKQGGAGGTATFNFNGGRLAARANDLDFMEGLNLASVKAGGAIIDTQGFNITISQNLVAGSPSGGLFKNGLGDLTLDGTSTYTGGTSVNGGSLIVSGAAATLGAGNATVLSTAITLSITTGVVNAILDTATISLGGGGTAAIADVGFMTLGTGIVETVGALLLNNVAQPVGTYGSTASAATFQSDEYFSGPGVVNVIPEPGTAVSLVGGTMMLLGLRRRRK